MKYRVAFVMTNGHEIRATVNVSKDIYLEAAGDFLADEFATPKFFHFIENDKLVFVNMSNVSHIRVYKAEEDV